MCKVIDDATASSSSHHPLVTAALQQQQRQQQQRQQRRKRVRFGTENETFELPTISLEEKYDRWYSRQDFQDIRWEIGAVVKGKALGLDKRFAKNQNNNKSLWDAPDNIYCYRGLEFLKLDPHSTEPSRKQRRSSFVRNVLVFQQVMNRRKQSSQVEQALGAYCTKMSLGAQERARCLASQDEREARQVYHECHLIYATKSGQEVSMFPCTWATGSDGGVPRSSMCRNQAFPDRTAPSFHDVVSRVFGGVGGMGLFATARVN